MTISFRPSAAALAALLLGACATAGPRSPADAIARLEAERGKNPNSAAALRALGIAYFQAERLPEARDMLDAAEQASPNDGATALFRGLTAEGLNDLTTARLAYTRYLAVGTSAKTKAEIRDRLNVVSRRELESTAKMAAAREGELSREAGPPNTIAVPPLRFTGTDTNLVPLERGVAELLITDLARSAQLTVLERERVQTLLDEVARGQSNRIDEATKVRTGKILQAGRLIQGSINQLGPDRISITAGVVSVPTSQITGSSTDDDGLEQLFVLEKKIVFQTFTNLGIELTPAERKLIDDAKPTRNLRAFLAYSRGLLADDRGDYFQATRFYNDATSLDPGFLGAGIRAASSTAAAQGTQVSNVTIQRSTAGSREGNVIRAAQTGEITIGTPGAAAQVANDVNVSQNANQANNGQTYSGGGLGGQNNGGGGGVPPANPAAPATSVTPIPVATGTITFIIRPPGE